MAIPERVADRRELHRGGHCVVCQAFQEPTKRKVAVQVTKGGPLAAPANKLKKVRPGRILRGYTAL